MGKSNHASLWEGVVVCPTSHGRDWVFRPCMQFGICAGCVLRGACENKSYTNHQPDHFTRAGVCLMPLCRVLETMRAAQAKRYIFSERIGATCFVNGLIPERLKLRGGVNTFCRVCDRLGS